MKHEDKELEKAVLGAIILEPQILPDVLMICKDEYFYDSANQIIFRTIRQMSEQNKHVDMLTLVAALKHSDSLTHVGGPYYISKLTDKVAGGGFVEKHVRKLNELFLLREMISLGGRLHSRASEASADPFELLEWLQSQVTDMGITTSSEPVHVGKVYDEMMDGLNRVIESGEPEGIPSGLDNLDKRSRFQPGTLNVLAARPGMGKTAVALKLIKYPAVVLNIPTAIFSLEMPRVQLMGRLISEDAWISSSAINQKKIDRKEFQDIGNRCVKIKNVPIYIDDTPGLRFMALRSKAHRLVAKYGVKLIVIDYIQLMAGKETGNREQEISYITRNLKTLSKELNIPIIALSQLSREVEKRVDKRPQLSDLRESGAIEQDADMVMFLYRPEYYGLFEETGYEFGTKTLPTRHLMLLDIAKAREMETGELPLRFIGQYMMVENYDLNSSDGNPLPDPLTNNTDFLNSQTTPF